MVHCAPTFPKEGTVRNMGLGANPYDELAELVKRAQAGDREAFRTLYQRTAQAQFFNISAKVGAEAATDILQEMYLIAWQNIADIKPRSFVGYLHAVGHNACLRYYDRASRSRETMLVRDDVTSLDETMLSGRVADETADPALVVDARDEHERLAQALREVLDEREREVILLRFYQEMRLDDIAEALDMSPSTVKRTIRRALDKLHGRLGDLPRGAAFPVLLAGAVEHPLAEGVPPRAQRVRSWPSDGAVRAVAAASALVVIGCLAAALSMERPVFSAPEVIDEAPVPTAEVAPAAEPADAVGPQLAAMATERGYTVLTLTDETGIAEAYVTDDEGARHDATSLESASDGLGATVYRFEIPSGTYVLTAIDTLGNTSEGTITVTLPPEDPISISDWE